MRFPKSLSLTTIGIALLSSPLGAQTLNPARPSSAPQAPQTPQKASDSQENEKPTIQSLSPTQLESLIKQLDELENQLGKDRTSRHAAALSTFTQASTSDKAAYELYLDCHRKVDFSTPDKKESDYRAWRDQNEGRIRNPAYLEALKLQLQYLAMTLRAANTEKRTALNSELLNYLNNVAGLVASSVQSKKDVINLDVLRRPVTGSIFARAFGLDQGFKVEKWSLNPLDLNAQFEEVLLPAARLEDPAKAVSLWDSRIQQETAYVSPGDDNAKQRFTEFRLPELRWGRATEVFNSGKHTLALTEMLSIIKNNLMHPKSSEWLKEIRDKIPSSSTLPTAP